MQIDHGRYIIEVDPPESSGYGKSIISTPTTISQETRELTLRVGRANVAYGMVQSPAKEPLQGVQIEIFRTNASGSWRIGVGQTNQDGSYRILLPEIATSSQ